MERGSQKQDGKTQWLQPFHHNICVLFVFLNLLYLFACAPGFQDYFGRYLQLFHLQVWTSHTVQRKSAEFSESIATAGKMLFQISKQYFLWLKSYLRILLQYLEDLNTNRESKLRNKWSRKFLSSICLHAIRKWRSAKVERKI